MITFPALLTAGKPFVRIVSCNPLEVRGEGVAPVFSGLPADDRAEWDAFRAEYDRTHREIWTRLQRLGASSRAPSRCPTWSSSTRAT